jgi:hypothetical protein
MITKEQPEAWKGIHKEWVKQTCCNGVGHFKVIALLVPFSFQKTRTTLDPLLGYRHLRQYSLNIGLSVLDFPGECIYLFIMPIGEGNLTGTIPRFFERIS